MPEASDVQSLLERFQRAEWITGFSGQNGKFSVEYTPKGIDRVQKLRAGFKDLKAAGYELTSLAAGETRECVAELVPPLMSPAETTALFGFIWQLDMK